MSMTQGMKRMRNLRTLLIGVPLLALIGLASWSVMSPPRFESTAQRLISRFRISDLEQLYQLKDETTHNGDRLECFVVDREIERVFLQEFCRIKDAQTRRTGKYLAYFFDDLEFAKAPNDFVNGLPAYDETSLSHLKATYVHGVLSIPNLKRDEPAVENP